MSASSSRFPLGTVGLLGSFLLVLAVAACGSQEEPESKPLPHAEESGVTFEGKTADGEAIRIAAGDQAALPEGFPEDVPLLPGGKPMTSMVGGSETMLSLSSEMSTEEIYQFYEQNLLGEGWAIGTDTEVMGARALNATKDQRQLTLMVLDAQGERRVSLMIATQ